jgi:hypothetical protein
VSTGRHVENHRVAVAFAFASVAIASAQVADGAIRSDGMTNVLTGLGLGDFDKSTASTFTRGQQLGPFELDALYENDGLAAKMVDLPANDLTREGFEIEGMEGVDLEVLGSAIEDAGVLSLVSDLHRWGSHYGGAILGVAVDDGLPPSEPLDLTRVGAVRGFFVLDRHSLMPVVEGRKAPTAYTIIADEDTPLEDRVIHASRVQRFAGVEVAPRRRPESQWWGVPAMQRVWSRFRQLASCYDYGEGILQDISLDVFTIAGMTDAFAAGHDELVRARLRSMQLQKSALRGIALDAGANGRPAETYTPQSRSVAGVHELILLYLQAFTAASPVPRSILVGETMGGLNTGSNSGEIRSWYAHCGAEQRNRLTPWVNWMLSIILSAKNGPTRGKLPPTWTTRWHPLWRPTEDEQADTRLKRAQADQIYWTMGSFESAEVRATRLAGGTGEIDEMPTGELTETDPDATEQEPDDVVTDPDPTDAEPAASPDAGESVQSSALNGAQIKSFLDLVVAVSQGTIELETAVKFLPIAFPGSIENEEQARRMLEDVVVREPAAPVIEVDGGEAA